MGRAVGIAALALVAACGRMGFDEQPQDDISKPDESSRVDADSTIDSPIGMGAYTLTESMAPYTVLDGVPALADFVPGEDERVHALALPFTFTFYGIAYDNVSVHTNGYITFGPPAPATYGNDCPLDTSGPDAMIAVFWDDLFASKMIMPFGTIRAVTSPASVEIEWHDMDAYYRAGDGNNFFSQGMRTTQKIVLHPAGKIDLHYGPRTGSTTTKDCGTNRYVGCSATVGLRAPSSAVLHTVQCGTELGPQAGFAPLVEGRLLRFTPS